MLRLVFSMSRPRWRDDVHLLLPGSAGEATFLLPALALMVLGLTVGVRMKRLARGFAAAWIGAALLLGGGYHWALARRNAVNDYPGMYAATRGDLPEVGEVHAWGVPALPLTLYFHRPVRQVEADQPLPPLSFGDPPTVTIAKANLLERAEAPGLVVVRRDRLGSAGIAVVRQGSPSQTDARSP